MKTETGRVVYDRKFHPFTEDRIVKLLMNRLNAEVEAGDYLAYIQTIIRVITGLLQDLLSKLIKFPLMIVNIEVSGIISVFNLILDLITKEKK